MKLTTLILALTFTLPVSSAFADKNFEEAAGGTFDCAEDPVVNVNHGTGTFTFTGACEAIHVNGDHLTVTIEDSGELAINGASNTVSVIEIGSILINGKSNKVRWKRAKSGTRPDVITNGSGNSVGGDRPARPAH